MSDVSITPPVTGPPLQHLTPMFVFPGVKTLGTRNADGTVSLSFSMTYQGPDGTLEAQYVARVPDGKYFQIATASDKEFVAQITDGDQINFGAVIPDLPNSDAYGAWLTLSAGGKTITRQWLTKLMPR